MKTKEYRERLAGEFANLLEEKELDWKKEWKAQSIPVNAKNGRSYRGGNRFYLSIIAMDRGYEDPRWATFNQIKDMGLKLKNAKGKGVTVEYWFPYDSEEKKVLSWQKYRKLGEQFGQRYQLRAKYYTVFNASHIEGIEPYENSTVHIEADDLIRSLSDNMGVEILNDGGNSAFYRVSEDKIHLPAPESFLSSYGYNSTALHELTHATGAVHRLNRNVRGQYGTEEYAFEELVAEISSCFMSAHLQIEQDEQHIQNHKAYVQGWAQTIRKQPDVLFRAIQQAEKATAYMEYKAELISKEKYSELSGRSMDVRVEDTEKKTAIINEAGKHNEMRNALSEIRFDNQYFKNILTIREYEASIGRINSVLENYDEKEIEEYALRCRKYLEFGREVDLSLAGDQQSRNALKVCDTPELMVRAGCRSLPMHITQKHMRDCMKEKSEGQPHFHGLTLEEIKRLPEELEDPAVLSQSPTREDSIIAILGYREQDGLPVLVSVVPDGHATYNLRRVESNFITSVYGKNNIQEYVSRLIERNQLIYMNKEKSQELALLPLQLRQDHLAPAFDCIIRKLDDDVKEGSENIMKNKHESLATESIGNWYDIPPDDRVITYPAEKLPAGWKWVVYGDGSGSLNSPDGKGYFFFDQKTGEYKITAKDKFGFDQYDRVKYDFPSFRSLAEAWVKENVLEKNRIQKHISYKELRPKL